MLLRAPTGHDMWHALLSGYGVEGALRSICCIRTALLQSTKRSTVSTCEDRVQYSTARTLRTLIYQWIAIGHVIIPSYLDMTRGRCYWVSFLHAPSWTDHARRVKHQSYSPHTYFELILLHDKFKDLNSRILDRWILLWSLRFVTMTYDII